MMNATAKTFLTAFSGCYSECRSLYTNEEFPRDVWPAWEYFFFAHNRSQRLRSESVLSKVAARLGLEYFNGEPLRLDAVLHRRGDLDCGFPFPILIALEHEEDPYTFKQEIMKLLSVRCPLKVGVTHAVTSTPQSQMERLRQTIAEKFRRVCEASTEDPTAEYLFLVGCQEVTKDPTWYYLEFTAGAGPDNAKFEPVPGIVGRDR